MKNLIFIFMLFLGLTCYAQQQTLVENTWYVSGLNIDGVMHNAPSNDEIENIAMYIRTDEGSCYNFNTYICHSMSGYSCNMTDTQFLFESFAVTTMEEVCDNPENTEFDGLYLSFYEAHTPDEPFNYTIETNDGDATLVVTNKSGYTATYVNHPPNENFQQILVENTWYLTQMNVNGVIHSTPYNEEISHVAMYIETSDGNNSYQFNTHICCSMQGISSNITNTNFLFDSFAATTLEECEDPENSAFSNLYVCFYMAHSIEEPFSYVIDSSQGNTILTVTNKLGNTATYANQPLSTQEMPQRPIAIYPNPVSDKLMVSGTDLSDNIRIKIFNLQGQLIGCMEGNNGKREFDLSKLSAGAYFVLVSNSLGEKLLSEKIIKK